MMKRGEMASMAGGRGFYFFVLSLIRKNFFFDGVVVSRAMNGMWERILYCYFCRMGEIFEKKTFHWINCGKSAIPKSKESFFNILWALL